MANSGMYVRMTFTCHAERVYGTQCDVSWDKDWIDVQDLRRFILFGHGIAEYVALMRLDERAKEEITTVCESCFKVNELPDDWMLVDYGVPI